MTNVCKLNSKGIECFKKYLNDLREKPDLEPPFKILENPDYSDAFQDKAKVEKVEFQHRTHMVEYLSKALESLNVSSELENQGLWSWLSLFYFEQVCPKDLDQKRVPGMEYRHILNVGYRYKHRHLLAGPIQVFQMYGEKARLFLSGVVHTENQVHHELGTRQSFITNPSIIEVADTLYFDKNKNKSKAGAQSRTRGGSLLRFINVMQQLELTFDLYSMSSEEILKLLPEEFDTWQDLQEIAG
jgi:hypothetical protein